MTISRFAAMALVAFGAAPALAETYPANGTGMGSVGSEQMPVRDDLILVHTQSSYDSFEMGQEDHPMSSLSGPCFGAAMVEAGAMSGQGYCHLTDADGDISAISWTGTGMDETGRTVGTWTVMGGTGKWDGATGGGEFDAGPTEDGGYTNEITGEVTLP